MNSVSVVPSRTDLAPKAQKQNPSQGQKNTVPTTSPNAASTIVPETARELAATPFLSTDKRFPKESRLLRHADFDRVYREGKRHFSANMTVFFLPRVEPPPAGLRIGLTVSRALGGAVDRNRMRRRMREAVRMTRPLTTPPIDVVINPKRLVLKAEFAVVVKEVGKAFETVLHKSVGGEK
jgi:ribonuclease P protein component